jgi:hypothetical protein
LTRSGTPARRRLRVSASLRVYHHVTDCFRPESDSHFFLLASLLFRIHRTCANSRWHWAGSTNLIV